MNILKKLVLWFAPFSFHDTLFRFTLEMISHINHVITTPYGHAILFGSGGDGRATAAR